MSQGKSLWRMFSQNAGARCARCGHWYDGHFPGGFRGTGCVRDDCPCPAYTEVVRKPEPVNVFLDG